MTDNDESTKPRVGIGYALGQFAKALQSAGQNAANRIEQWSRVIRGIEDGILNIGSRTPFAKTPAWVTLEVVHGGFATGSFVAGGALRPHEIALCRRLNIAQSTKTRAEINAYFLSDLGRAELRQQLKDGKYRVECPEQAGLLIATWLLDHGHAAEASALFEQIAPWFAELGFYPTPAETAKPQAEGTFVAPVREVAAKLAHRQANISVMKQREELLIYTPLYDQLVALFFETVADGPPTFLRAQDGSLIRQSNGQPVVEGGWVCVNYPPDFNARGQSILDAYEEAAKQYFLCKKPHDRKENFSVLRELLRKILQDPKSLSTREVLQVRKILAGYHYKHGLPGSEQRKTTREAQAYQCSLPLHADIAHRLAEGLAELPQGDGVLDDDRVALIAEALGPTDSKLPPHLERTLLQCLHAPIETLLDRGVIGSSEVLARCLVPVAGAARGQPITDAELKRVFVETYFTFRQRRSLLLLNYESQVRFEELPWIAAISSQLAADPDGTRTARDLLADTTMLALKHFAPTIFPNKFVRELFAISTSAGLKFPFVYELAADIFMGEFAEGFLRNAKQASPLLKDTLYERYYGVSFAELDRVEPTAGKDGQPAISKGFSSYAAKLSARDLDPKAPAPGYVVANALVIEQAIVLTTHNVAGLIETLGLQEPLKGEYVTLANKCFHHCVALLQRLPKHSWRLQMQRAKLSAYAWRNMLLFLSLATQEERKGFLLWAQTELNREPEEFQRRFAPVMAGLQMVEKGETFGALGVHQASGARRFLGWNPGRHWVLPPAAPK